MFTMPKVKPKMIPTQGLPLIQRAWAVLTSVRRWEMAEDWKFKMFNGIEIIIPKGFEFDGASIPKPVYFLAGVLLVLLFIGIEISASLMLFLSILFMSAGLMLSPVGIMLIAGIIHDFAYSYGYLWRHDGEKLVKYRYGNGTRLDWDELFLRVNLQVNGVIYSDHLAALLLKMFGGIAWEKARQANYLEIRPQEIEVPKKG